MWLPLSTGRAFSDQNMRLSLCQPHPGGWDQKKGGIISPPFRQPSLTPKRFHDNSGSLALIAIFGFSLSRGAKPHLKTYNSIRLQRRSACRYVGSIAILRSVPPPAAVPNGSLLVLPPSLDFIHRIYFSHFIIVCTKHSSLKRNGRPITEPPKPTPEHVCAGYPAYPGHLSLDPS